jgi:hypothetical protein
MNQRFSKVRVQGKCGFFLDGVCKSVDQTANFSTSYVTPKAEKASIDSLCQVCHHYATLAFDRSESEQLQRLRLHSTSSERLYVCGYPDSIIRRLQIFNENNAKALQILTDTRFAL